MRNKNKSNILLPFIVNYDCDLLFPLIYKYDAHTTPTTDYYIIAQTLSVCLKQSLDDSRVRVQINVVNTRTSGQSGHL